MHVICVQVNLVSVIYLPSHFSSVWYPWILIRCTVNLSLVHSVNRAWAKEASLPWPKGMLYSQNVTCNTSRAQAL